MIFFPNIFNLEINIHTKIYIALYISDINIGIWICHFSLLYDFSMITCTKMNTSSLNNQFNKITQ